MHAPSQLAIFPIQDLVAMDRKLRRCMPNEEQINEPSNPKHYWRFRFHLNLDELIRATQLNQQIRKLVNDSGRDTN